MTKEEKIKEAWGEYYELVKNELDEHGRYSYYDDNSIKRKSKLWQFENIETHQISNLNLLIPSSIKGIEDNNGWIKIESEDNLPKESGLYFILDEVDNIINSDFDVEFGQFFTKDFAYDHYELTHYQPIEKPKPPLF